MIVARQITSSPHRPFPLQYTLDPSFFIFNFTFSIFRMNSFSHMKDMYNIQREAKRIKKELKNVHVEAEAGPPTSLGTYTVKVIVSAEQEIIRIEIAPEADATRLGDFLRDALNRALKKAQVVAAERMQVIMKKMGMPTTEE